MLLENSGEGDGFMSAEFQHTLGGRRMADTNAGTLEKCAYEANIYEPASADVAFGSKVSIRHVNTQGGYLHSHPHSYPGGSKRTFFHVAITVT